MRLLQTAFRQPLLYFVVIGASVFLVDAMLRRSTQVVEVTELVQSEVKAELERASNRPPTTEELERGVQDWIDTELLFREASRLGLQENDAVIRAHLTNKLKQLVRQGAITAAPTDDELREELASHAERYIRPDLYDVTHVFINKTIDSEHHEQRVADALTQLRAGADPEKLGDHFPRGPRFRGMLRLQLEQALRVELPAALEPRHLGQWQRFSSQRGAHLVRLDAIQSGRPELEKLRGVLTANIEEQKRDDAVRAFTATLRERYPVDRATSP